MRTVALAVGVAVLVANTAGVVRVLIVPRPAGSTATAPMRVVRAVFGQLARLPKHYETKDRLLALSEPVALVTLLATWLVIATGGFTLLDWGLGRANAAGAFAEAGSAVFTLGAATRGSTHHVADFAAAASGMALVALQIAYLPSIYGAYNRRETLVTLLESRAGTPAWGPELLVRHQLVASVANLPSLFAEWERWAADVAESHASYPSLLYLRSPRARNSWVVSLVAVLDAAALALAVDPDGAPIEARMCVRMGFTCLRDLARVLAIPFDPDPLPSDPIALPRVEFDDALARLAAAGYPRSREPDEAWLHFRGWRVNYEAVAYAVADRLNAPPARWTGPRRLFAPESLTPMRPEDRRPAGTSARQHATPPPLADVRGEPADGVR